MATNNYEATNGGGVTYTLTHNNLLSTYSLVIGYPAGGGTDQTINFIPDTNVLTASGGDLTIISAVVGSTYVIPPDVTGTVDITVALATLFPNTIYIGGTATINSTVAVLSGLSIHVDGGTATVANGDLLGALSGSTVYLDNGGTFSNGNAVASVLNGTTINFGLNGGTFIANANGTLLDLSSTTINGYDGNTDNIEFENLPAPVDHYSITTSGSSQVIGLFGSDGIELGTVTVAGTTFPTGTVFQGDTGPLTITESGANVIVTAAASVFTCFLAGTHILTPQGEILIENLKAGDCVITAAGERAEIKQVAVTQVATQFVSYTQVMPVLVMAGSFGDGLPKRDLYVSPDHSFFFDGVLVPAQLLMNGSTIRQINQPGLITYYHIELEPHDLIVAEGVVTESFLDTGVQWRNSARRAAELLPTTEPKTWEDACAPLVLSGPQLHAIQAQLQMKADTEAFSAVFTRAA